MSWQDYVDKQLLASRCVTKAAIAGHDGNVWAKSEGFEKSLNLYGFDDEFVLLMSAHASMKVTSRNSTTVNHASRCWRQVSKEELAKLVQSFEEQDILTSSGVTLAGNRYIYLSGTDRVIRAKLGKVGVHCMKTTQAVVVSLYEDPIQPQQAASVVEKLGEYLVSCGY
ncbi:Profilin [Trachymyrmex cornetzi]|uniref:Profilin n=1 Tax=Trachymyrmex cornetzi TaxID=471704 RepID=A0A195E2I3_9HYME|nr:Profilin [Trachymyrmex cornetzi]